MKAQFKEHYHKMVELWQSKNPEFDKMNIAAVYFAIIGVILFFSACFFHNPSESILQNTMKYILGYWGMVIILIALNLGIIYIYIYNQSKRFAKCAEAFLPLIIVIFTSSIIFCIPFTIFLCLLSRMIEVRAKKLSNITDFLIYFWISLILCFFLGGITIALTCKITTMAFNFIQQWGWKFNSAAFAIFLGLGFLKFEIDGFFKILIWIKSRLHRKKRNRKTNAVPSITDLEYDIMYQKKTLLKAELLSLIILFFLTALNFMPADIWSIMETYQGDVINVLTIYTLIILYIDKRKEWK